MAHPSHHRLTKAIFRTMSTVACQMMTTIRWEWYLPLARRHPGRAIELALSNSKT